MLLTMMGHAVKKYNNRSKRSLIFPPLHLASSDITTCQTTGTVDKMTAYIAERRIRGCKWVKEFLLLYISSAFDILFVAKVTTYKRKMSNVADYLGDKRPKIVYIYFFSTPY